LGWVQVPALLNRFKIPDQIRKRCCPFNPILTGGDPIPDPDAGLLKFCENRFAIFLIPAAIERLPKNRIFSK